MDFCLNYLNTLIKKYYREGMTDTTKYFISPDDSSTHYFYIAFEPDFILLANDKKVGNTSWQIFIEPKGSQFLDSNNTFENSKEGWKEKFLLQITERDEAKTLLDNDRYRIVGLPFFNNDISKKVVKSNLKHL